MTVTLWFWILAGLALAYLILGATYVVRHNREVKRGNLERVEKIVSGILYKIEHPRGWWAGGGVMEFVSVILGPFPCHRQLWARVQWTKSQVFVYIEYYWDVNSDVIWWANAVAKNLWQKDILVEVRSSLVQPNEEAIYPDLPKPVRA